MRDLALLLALAFAPLCAHATVVDVAPLDDLFEGSELVVSGVIESASLLPKGCGVSYTLRADNVLKGNARFGDVVTFLNLGTTQVGNRYVVFLSPTNSQFEPVISTNSVSEAPRIEQERHCKGYWPTLSVNIWGNGAFEVVGWGHDDSKLFAVFNERQIEAPKKLKVEVTDFPSVQRSREARSAFGLNELLSYLRRLSDGD